MTPKMTAYTKWAYNKMTISHLQLEQRYIPHPSQPTKVIKII